MDVPRLLTLVLLTAALAVPGAAAHTAAYSVDGKVRASVGFLNEPVVTYKDTGLDLCFTQNQTASPRTALTDVNPGALTATLHAPGGQTLHQDLAAQFGKPGCFQFAKPLVLTQAGVYHLDLSGDINGTRYDRTGIVVGSANGIEDRGEVTWPDEGVPTNLELQDRVADLEDELAGLQNRVAAQEDAAAKDKGAPAPAAALLLVGLAALAAVRRRAA